MKTEIAKGTIIKCPLCDFTLEDAYKTHCPVDGEMLVPYFQHIAKKRPNNTLFAQRFADVLPFTPAFCREPESLKTQLLFATSFGKEFGIDNLALKDECSLPTGTTKARMAAGAIGFLHQCNVSHFVVTSTGNSTTAMARLMQEYPEMKMTAFAGKEFIGRHEFTDIPNIDFRPVAGDFVSAEVAAKEFAHNYGVVWEGGFFNSSRRIALATAYLEACEEIGGAPDWYFQAVSSGMGLVGVGEVAKAQTILGNISCPPRLVAVQQESCSPMVKAFQEGFDNINDSHRIINPKGVAKAILRGDPTASYPIVLKHVQATKGSFISVSEKDILWAKILLAEKQNLHIGESAAAALAAALKMGRAGTFSSNDLVLVNLTGKT